MFNVLFIKLKFIKSEHSGLNIGLTTNIISYTAIL